MPEGHVVHSLARRLGRRFTGHVVRVDSPQGRFAAEARLVDGRRVAGIEAHGKHLFIGFDDRRWIHVHLGLYGKWRIGAGEVPPPAGMIRLRLQTDESWAELRGPAVCELLDDAGKRLAVRRIGPDPIRRGSDSDAAWERVHRSGATIGSLLMDQRVLSGVGNIYRAEVLFRHGISPYRLGRDLTREQFDALWADLVDLMRAGARTGRIDTVRPEHMPRAMGRAPRRDRHGGEVYVYRRTGRPCLVCGTPVASAEMLGRTLYWCPGCQPNAASTPPGSVAAGPRG